MRPLLTAALLSLLAAACGVKTEGAACALDGAEHCPVGQACGSDLRCSEAATACSRAGICSQSTCEGSTPRICVAESATCAHYVDEAACSERQTCDLAATGGSHCVCTPNACQTSQGASSCDGSGNLVTCAQEAATGCWYVDGTPAACLDAGQVCSAGACACPSNRCEPSHAASVCEGTQLVACRQVTNSACFVEEPAVACADAAMTCQGSACACTGTAGMAAGQLCATAGEVRCDNARVMRCTPVGSSPSCNTWVETDCAATGLTCDAGACVCPSPGASPRTLFADATAPRQAGLAPSGVESPPACRYASLGEALAATATGDTVRASGYAGAPVVFTEGPLTVKAGVTLTTADAPLTTTHYVVEPAAGVAASALVTLEAGASLSGFELRNAAATGPAIRTSCAASGDTAPVDVHTVAVSGTTAPFAAGVQHGGHCPVTVSASTIAACVTAVIAAPDSAGVPVALTLSGSTLTGSTDSAIQALGLGSSSTLTLAGNTITGNAAATGYTLGVHEHRGGGIVFTAPLPVTAFTGNRIAGNGWDQILVATSSAAATLDLRGGATSAACGATSNAICRSPATPPASVLPFVGVFSNGAPVQVDWNGWTQQPALSGEDIGGTGITGAASSCPIACP